MERIGVLLLAVWVQGQHVGRCRQHDDGSCNRATGSKDVGRNHVRRAVCEDDLVGSSPVRLRRSRARHVSFDLAGLRGSPQQASVWRLLSVTGHMHAHTPRGLPRRPLCGIHFLHPARVLAWQFDAVVALVAPEQYSGPAFPLLDQHPVYAGRRMFQEVAHLALAGVRDHECLYSVVFAP